MADQHWIVSLLWELINPVLNALGEGHHDVHCHVNIMPSTNLSGTEVDKPLKKNNNILERDMFVQESDSVMMPKIPSPSRNDTKCHCTVRDQTSPKESLPETVQDIVLLINEMLDQISHTLCASSLTLLKSEEDSTSPHSEDMCWRSCQKDACSRHLHLSPAISLFKNCTNHSSVVDSTMCLRKTQSEHSRECFPEYKKKLVAGAVICSQNKQSLVETDSAAERLATDQEKQHISSIQVLCDPEVDCSRDSSKIYAGVIPYDIELVEHFSATPCEMNHETTQATSPGPIKCVSVCREMQCSPRVPICVVTDTTQNQLNVDATPDSPNTLLCSSLDLLGSQMYDESLFDASSQQADLGSISTCLKFSVDCNIASVLSQHEQMTMHSTNEKNALTTNVVSRFSGSGCLNQEACESDVPQGSSDFVEHSVALSSCQSWLGFVSNVQRKSDKILLEHCDELTQHKPQSPFPPELSSQSSSQVVSQHPSAVGDGSAVSHHINTTSGQLTLSNVLSCDNYKSITWKPWNWKNSENVASTDYCSPPSHSRLTPPCDQILSPFRMSDEVSNISKHEGSLAKQARTESLSRESSCNVEDCNPHSVSNAAADAIKSDLFNENTDAMIAVYESVDKPDLTRNCSMREQEVPENTFIASPNQCFPCETVLTEDNNLENQLSHSAVSCRSDDEGSFEVGCLQQLSHQSASIRSPDLLVYDGLDSSPNAQALLCEHAEFMVPKLPELCANRKDTSNAPSFVDDSLLSSVKEEGEVIPVFEPCEQIKATKVADVDQEVPADNIDISRLDDEANLYNDAEHKLENIVSECCDKCCSDSDETAIRDEDCRREALEKSEDDSFVTHMAKRMERLERLLPLQTCKRPRRVGLSRKQKVPSLHARLHPYARTSNV